MESSKRIVQAINQRLKEYDLHNHRLARSFAIGLANDVKKIVEADFGKTLADIEDLLTEQGERE